MSKIVIRTPRSPMPALSLVAALPLALLAVLPFSHASPQSLLGAAAILALSALLFWGDIVRCSRVAEIDPVAKKVRVSYRTPALRSKSHTYAADRFVAITSYITQERYAMNRLELITKEQQALLLASLQPGSKHARFWTLLAPAEVESVEALAFRPLVANRLGLKDTGFLGYRATTEPL